MADAVFFRVIERDVINRTVTEMEDLADGYLRVFASEVPYVSLLLFRTLATTDGTQKQIFATDLTRNPKILLTRQDYLAANRHLIKAGGSIQRIFVCRVDNLMTQSFAEDLIALVDQHRSVGVLCGLAIWDQLRATEAIDFVVFSRAAVLVEDEQGDVAYTIGRSTVHFKRVEVWLDRFFRLWEGNETPAATEQLANYEFVVRRMTSSNLWSGEQVRKSLGLHGTPPTIGVVHDDASPACGAAGESGGSGDYPNV